MRKLLLIIILICLGGCTTLSSLFDSTPATEEHKDKPPVPETHTVAVERLRVPERVPLTTLELRWQAPKDDSSDGFVIYYGESPNQLSKNVRVTANELEVVHLPSGDLIYRYLLHDLPPDRSIWVAVSSFRGSEESALTGATEVAPKEIVLNK